MDLININYVSPNPQMREWAEHGAAHNNNFFDPRVLLYPSTINVAARSKDKTVLYMPVQTALILESLAINPDASRHEIAVALREAIVSLSLLAQQKGIGEGYFLGTNEQTNEFARRHGLEELKWKIFRFATFTPAPVVQPGVIQTNEDISLPKNRPDNRQIAG